MNDPSKKLPLAEVNDEAEYELEGWDDGGREQVQQSNHLRQRRHHSLSPHQHIAIQNSL